MSACFTRSPSSSGFQIFAHGASGLFIFNPRTTMSRIIQDHFETLWEKAAAPNSPQIQKQESERMFYAGFASCYGAFMAASESMPEDLAESYLNSIRTEIKDYFKLLGKLPQTHGSN